MSYADSTNPNAPVSMTDKWDKTFAESQKVEHREFVIYRTDMASP